MHFLEFGRKKKPALIILHGWGNTGEKYLQLAKILASDFYVLVPDLPGFGKTRQPKKAYDVEAYAVRVKKFLKKQKINSAFFIGHSFGGRIVIKLASKFPKLVKGIVFTGVPGVEKFYLKRSIMRVVKLAGAKALKIFVFIPAVKRMRKHYYSKRDFGKVEGVMKETFLKIIKENLTADAKKIKQPTLLLWGRRDQMAPVIDAEKMLSIIPNSYLKIFTKVGHRLPYEKPYEFAHEVVQFFL